MTCIAWDGKTLAADRQATLSGRCLEVGKLRYIGGEVVAATGDLDYCEALIGWYTRRKVGAIFPESQKTPDWGRLVVATTVGLFLYERNSVALKIESPFAAFGSGGDFAMGAMAMGADARTAVEVASKLCSDCGFGVDTGVPFVD